MTIAAGARGGPPRGGVDSGYAWFRMLIAVVLGTVGSVGMWAVVLILPPVQQEFGVDRAAASLPYTLTMIGFGLGNVLLGRFVDRFGIVLPVVMAALMLGAGFVGAAFATAVWQLAVIQGVLIGVGTAATFGPLIADLSHWFRKRRGIAVAAAASGNYLAGAIWPNLLDGYVQSLGWRPTYIGIGIACVCVMIPLAMLLRRRLPVAAPSSPAGPATMRQVAAIDLSPRALQLLLSVAGVACCVAMSMPQVHMVAYCADLGYGLTSGAQMLSLMLAGGVISRFLSGALADYTGGIWTLLIGSVLQCLALVFYLPFDGLMSLYIVSFMFG
ncbi:MAG: MFS transporter, partial [Hyphomicrobiaceae bacterium]|nr:MFS transporter [Hyphomicrobiaceae bacterium]